MRDWFFVETSNNQEQDIKDYGDWIQGMIDEGYINGQNLAPIKCVVCGSSNLHECNKEIGGYNIPQSCLTEYDVQCLDCGEIVAHWAYGGWSY